MEGNNSVVSIENYDNQPDYFVENMKRLFLDKNGKVQNELVSPLVKHFPNDDSLEFKSPKMKIHEKYDSMERCFQICLGNQIEVW